MTKTARCRDCFRSFTYSHVRGRPRTRCDEHHVVTVKKPVPELPPQPATPSAPAPTPAKKNWSTPESRNENAIRNRKASHRRRRIDPATCEIEYTADDLEFQRAMEQYKRASRRPFPTLKEVLEVVRSLGYRKVAPSA